MSKLREPANRASELTAADELRDDELDVGVGGKLYEAAAKGVHFPEVTLAL